ncbi:hypothetical protein [Chitinolyticbacter albus]|uniref:hypothetical protein n=1 Tax=Chitinolyticbacter albus TaxID=2961951 RepID=UPI00210CFB2A|nr:hypothetical protein [Chitinolyticbacter albus]
MGEIAKSMGKGVVVLDLIVKISAAGLMVGVFIIFAIRPEFGWRAVGLGMCASLGFIFAITKLIQKKSGSREDIQNIKNEMNKNFDAGGE